MTTRINVLFLLLTAVFLLTGCAKMLSAGSGFGGITGINERAVLINQITGSAKDAKKYRICAEPSPDAIQTAFAEAKINARKYAEASINIGLDQEYIGLRTQAIQLLRDAMYRSCEAFLNGGIDTTQYSLLLRRHQRYMISLLAVESLTGTVRATSPLASLQQTLARVEANISKTKTEIKQLQEDNGLEAQQKAMQITEKNKNLKQYQGFQANLYNAIGPVANSINNSTDTDTKTPNHSTQVVNAVANIVEDLTSFDDLWAECFAYLKLTKSQSDRNSNFYTVCSDHIDSVSLKTQQLNEQETELNVQESELKVEEKGVKVQETKLKVEETVLKERELELKENELKVREAELQLKQQEQQYLESKPAIQALEEQKQELKEQRNELQEQKNEIQEELQEQEQELKEQEQELKEQEQELKEQKNELKTDPEQPEEQKPEPEPETGEGGETALTLPEQIIQLPPEEGVQQ